MKESVMEELRQRAAASEDESEIEMAFSEVDARLRSLVELIDSAHDARVAELEQEAASFSDAALRGAR
ncbi:MAG: hypothetical protein HY899_17810 [Deltaproteobacteria bacterium]|nr:hypothetical protein [Deltaproteobacteria bacterium]